MHLPRHQLALRGRRFDCRTTKDVIDIILRELAKSDPALLEYCARHRAFGTARTATLPWTPEECGWLVTTQNGNNIKRKIIDRATEIAGLKPDPDIVLSFRVLPIAIEATGA